MNALGKTSLPAGRRSAPVFGIKGGAAGSSYAQVVPMGHQPCTLPATFAPSARLLNLLAAAVDARSAGQPLNIDPRRITRKRCMDMNDRQLRFIVDGLGGKVNGTRVRTALTSPLPARSWRCSARHRSGGLKARLSRIVCAYTRRRLARHRRADPARRAR